MATKAQKAQAEADNWESLLDKAYDELPEDAILPEGSWRFDVVSAARKEATETANEQITVFLRAIEPLKDVNEVQMDEFEAAGLDIKAAKPTVTIFIEGASDYRKFLKLMDTAGIGGKVNTLRKMPEVRGAGGTIIGKVTHRRFKDKETGEERVAMRVAKYGKDA